MASISGASIYRLVAFDRYTILCDEAEKIVSAKASINTELLEILRAGYKHSGLCIDVRVKKINLQNFLLIALKF